MGTYTPKQPKDEEHNHRDRCFGGASQHTKIKPGVLRETWIMISPPELQKPILRLLKQARRKRVTKTQGIIGTGVVVHACNSSTKKAEAELSEFKLAWAIK